MALNSTTGTISILKALQEQCNQTNEKRSEQSPAVKQRKLPLDPLIQALAVDLTVAILYISVDHQFKKCEMLIGDHSLERHQCARMQFWKLSNADLDKCRSIQKGDIVRLNCVTVRNIYIKLNASGVTGARMKATAMYADYDANANANCNALSKMKENVGVKDTIIRDDASADMEKLSTVLCDFYHSFLNPTIGSSFGKIASFNPMVHGGYTFTEWSRLSTSCKNLITPKKTIDAVRGWFLENHHRSAQLGARKRFEQDHNHHRCQTRKVRELTDPHMLSDVLVRISQLNVDDTAAKNPYYYRRQNRSPITIFRAILMDGDDDHIMQNERDAIPFHIESCNPLLQRVKQFAHTRDIFLLRKVRTEHNDVSRRPYAHMNLGDRCGNGTGTDLKEVILVPTANTSIDPMPSTENIARSKRICLSNSFELHPSMSESPASLEEHIHSSAQMFTWEHSPNKQQGELERLPLVTSSLSCIHFEDDNLPLRFNDESSWPTLSTLANMFTISDESNKNKYLYKPAKLTICEVGTGDLPGNNVTVKASAEIMSTLCGSYDPICLQIENVEAGDKTAKNVLELLRGLMFLRVPLEWVLVRKIKRGESVVHVQYVSLPSLEF